MSSPLDNGGVELHLCKHHLTVLMPSCSLLVQYLCAVTNLVPRALDWAWDQQLSWYTLEVWVSAEQPAVCVGTSLHPPLHFGVGKHSASYTSIECPGCQFTLRYRVWGTFYTGGHLISWHMLQPLALWWKNFLHHFSVTRMGFRGTFMLRTASNPCLVKFVDLRGLVRSQELCWLRDYLASCNHLKLQGSSSLTDRLYRTSWNGIK